MSWDAMDLSSPSLEDPAKYDSLTNTGSFDPIMGGEVAEWDETDGSAAAAVSAKHAHEWEAILTDESSSSSTATTYSVPPSPILEINKSGVCQRPERERKLSQRLVDQLEQPQHGSAQMRSLQPTKPTKRKSPPLPSRVAPRPMVIEAIYGLVTALPMGGEILPARLVCNNVGTVVIRVQRPHDFLTRLARKLLLSDLDQTCALFRRGIRGWFEARVPTTIRETTPPFMMLLIHYKRKRWAQS